MFRRNLFLQTLVLTGVFVLGANPSLHAKTAPYQYVSELSQIRFDADSTLHKIHGTAEGVNGRVVFDPETSQTEELPQIEIAVLSMESGNKRRDKAMYKMFQADQYPLIHWEAHSFVCQLFDDDQTSTCEAEGVLQIREVKRPVSFQVRLTRKGSDIQVSGSTLISLKDFGLHPPSVLGLIRVSDDVSLNFESVWTAKQA